MSALLAVESASLPVEPLASQMEGNMWTFTSLLLDYEGHIA